MEERRERQKILITGATNGIGKEMALKLVEKGHSVGITGRDPEKVAAVRDELMKIKSSKRLDDQVTISTFDFNMGNLSDVNNAVESIDGGHFDTVICNAGVLFPPRPASGGNDPNLEETLKTNVLGHYLLARRLIDLAEEHTPPRRPITFVWISSTMASKVHRGGHWPHRPWPSTVDGFRSFFAPQWSSDGWLSYIDSKLATIVIAQDLAKDSERAGSGVKRSVAIHPGVTQTNMFSSVPPLQRMVLGWIQRVLGWLQLSNEKIEEVAVCASRVIEGAVFKEEVENETNDSKREWICGDRQPIPTLRDEQKKAFMEFIKKITEEFMPQP